MKVKKTIGKIYKPLPHEISEFVLMGYRQKDGTIKLANSLLEDFPNEVKVCEVIYSLEKVIKNEKNELLPNEGKNMEWAVYT